MKTKTMSLLALAMFGFLTIFMVGCQKDDETFDQQQELSHKQGLEDVSKVSLQRLAEMQYDQSIAPSVYYESLKNRISSLSQEEYDEYLSYWIDMGVQRLIDENIVSEKDRDIEIEREYEKRRKYDEKAKELYGIPMYKLDLKQENIVLDTLEEFNIKTSYKSSCPNYYYPYPVSNDGTGTYSCVAVHSAANTAEPWDCNWEFQYNTPLALGKVKTSGLAAYGIFLAGGINARIPSAPYTNQVRFLVGQGRIDKAYVGSGYSAALLFAADVKFRGLLS